MVTTPLPSSPTTQAVIYSPTATTGQYKQPRTAPIAHFTSLPNDGIGNETLAKKTSPAVLPTAGRLLAVNSSYIAYAVKKGLVRVIDRNSGAKTLLRGHDERTRMVDAAFFGENANRTEGVGGVWDELLEQKGGNSNSTVSAPTMPPSAASDVLATIGGMGDSSTVLIWRIHSASSKSLAADKLLEVQFNRVNRLVWHPFNPNRFLLLHRRSSVSDDDDDDDDGDHGRTVATLVETTSLVTKPHATGGHEVYKNDPGAVGVIPGMTSLTNQNEDATVLAGANDITWSNTDAKHVLTGHEDGHVRLWDLTRTATGAAEEEIPLSSRSSIACAAKMSVVGACSTAGMEESQQREGVTRVIFLSQYQDSKSRVMDTITPPFVTGMNVNHTVTLWSSFTSNNGSNGNTGIKMPSRLRVFGLTSIDTTTLSSMMSMELIPAPYRPPLGDEDATTTAPSSFVVLADRKVGIMHALHLDTEWKQNDTEAADDAAPEDNAASLAVAVKGFDHVTTLSVVHPIYSFCVAPSSSSASAVGPPGLGKNGLKEERHVDLCCIQSKAVQMLTLSAEMCVAPTVVPNGGSDLAMGVTLMNLPEVVGDDDEVTEGEVDYEEFEEKELEEEEFEDDYEMEEEEGAQYSTNDSEEEDDDDAVMPIPAASEPAAFSNWLGAIASPLPPPAAAVAKATSIPNAPVVSGSGKLPPGLPPGLGFSSILPPPPGMAAAAPAPVPVAAIAPKAVIPSATPAPSSYSVPPLAPALAFLSPMQMLSGSGSDLEPPKKQQKDAVKAKSTSPVPVAPVAIPAPSVSAPPSAPVPTTTTKKSNKKQNKKSLSHSASPAIIQPNTAAPVMKILQREEPKEESSTRSSILPPHGSADPAINGSSVMANTATVDLSAIETTVQRTIANHMKVHENQLLTSLRKIIATEVSQAMAKNSSSSKDKEIAANKNKNVFVEQAVSRGVASGLNQGLGQSLDGGKLGKRLEKHAKDSAALAAKEAVDKMQVPIINSLHETMREVMIPAYEAATRQMFQQTSTSLEQGLAQMSVSMNQSNNASAPVLEAMSAQMMKMSEVISSLSAEVVQLRGAVNAVSSDGGNQPNGNTNQQGGPGTQQQQQQQASMGIRNEVMALCQAQRYEEMFTKAVSANDGGIVLFACKNTDSTQVFNGAKVGISQPILICLMQQLGAVLVSATDAGDVKIILNWLQEIAVTIDPANVNIQRHVGSVVQQLLANINDKMSNCDPAFQRPLQMLMRVIRGLL